MVDIGGKRRIYLKICKFPVHLVAENYYHLLLRARGDEKYPFIPPLKYKNGIICPDMEKALLKAMLQIQELKADPLQYMQAQLRPFVIAKEKRGIFNPNRLYGKGATKRFTKFIQVMNENPIANQSREGIKMNVDKGLWDEKRKTQDRIAVLFGFGHLFSPQFTAQKILELSTKDARGYLQFLRDRHPGFFCDLAKKLEGG